MGNRFRVDEKVVYLHQRCASHPAPKAKNILASKRGEQYVFQIENYWVVCRILTDERVEARNLSGTRYIIACDDPQLRKATWWERWFKARAFPRSALD